MRPTDFQKRLNMTFGKPDEQLIDPYVTIDVDETHVAQTTTKQKTFSPVWNESFEHSVENAKTLTLTVFHDAAIPPDDFVANCSIPFEDLLNKTKEGDFRVSALHFALHFSRLKHQKSRHPFKTSSATPLPLLLNINNLRSFPYLQNKLFRIASSCSFLWV